MPRPNTRAPRSSRAYALENAAFLRHLAATGNAREAARAMSASRSRFTKRRAKDSAFAARWDAALVMAQASLSSPERGGGPLKAVAEGVGRGHLSTKDNRPPVIVRRRDGTAQVRRRLPTAISPEAEQRFLFALCATANVRLSARAAGFAHSSFCTRKRKHPAFAREWKEALALGCERIELALIQGWSPQAHAHDAWAHNDPPPIPPMSPSQALQLLYLHHKEAKALELPEPLRRRRGESREAYNERLTLLGEARLEREREKFRATQAALKARGEPPYWGGDWPDDPHEPPRPVLPDLAQVTGWSKADPAKTPHDEKRALFGGWRIGDMRRKMEEG